MSRVDKCKNCDCLKFFIDSVSCEKSCINCGVVMPFIVMDINTLTHDEKSNYNFCNGARKTIITPTEMNIDSSTPSRKKARMIKIHKKTNRDLCQAQRSLNEISSTRESRRYEQVMKIIDERVDILSLSTSDMDMIKIIHYKMDVKYYPRPIELHALILIALATRYTSQISYQRICDTSNSVPAKSLISFVKKICDSLGIARPVSNPTVMIGKHMSVLGLSRRQMNFVTDELKRLIKERSSLHPMTHMSVAILNTVNTVDVEHTSAYDITPRKIAYEVGTTLSTLLSKYEEFKKPV